MAAIVVATHNMLFLLNPTKWNQDLAKSGMAHVTGYQEAEGKEQRQTLVDYCAKAARGLYHPKSCGNPISWNKSTYDQAIVKDKPVQGVRDVHLGAVAMGVNAKFNPPRDFAWVGLVHKASQQKHLIINVHPLAGGTKPEDAKDNTDSDALSAYKDWGIAQYWLDIMAFTAAEMSVNDPGAKSMTQLWDAILLVGDFNAQMNNARRWYYPGAMLLALYHQDPQVQGLDHIMRTKGSNLKAGERSSQAGNTDHRIHFQRYTITDVPDYPREK